MKEFYRKNKLMLYILLITVVATSAPLYTDFILFGEDVGATLGRIRAFSDGILRMLPVRIQPLGNQDYGYSAAAFSSDVFYFLPGALYRAGLSLELSYKYTVLVFNVLTAIISYTAFAYMADEKLAGMSAAFAYMLCPARIYSVYMAGNFGELFGWCFIPLALMGIWALYSKKDMRTALYLLVLGYSLLLLSSTVFFVGGAVLYAILFLVHIRDNIRKESIIFNLKAVMIFVTVNLWFLFPMLSRMRNASAVAPLLKAYIRNYGVYLSQYFRVYEFAGVSSDTWINGTESTRAVGPGFAVILVLISYIILCFVRGGRSRTANRILALSAVFMLMSSNHFPWDIIQNKNLLFSIILAFTEMPVKFAVTADALLIAAFAVIISGYGKELKEKAYTYIIAVICLLDYILFQFQMGRIMIGRAFMRGEDILNNADVGYVLIYDEAAVWRVSELVSAVSLVVIIAIIIINNKGRKHADGND